MAEPNDPDSTEVSASGDDDATEAPANDYTQFGGSGSTTTSTGFEAARSLAEKAQREQGRLLKKRFVLEDELGAGGMGVVYKARDLRKVEAEDSNPYIAAKVLGANFRDHPHAFVSLQQEAVKSQKLAHPNIVTVHDFDRDGDTIFMTMELLKGDPLDNLLKLDAPFSRETCIRYFNELCAGLEYAHKRGLIHSDFKPGNIFVTTGGVVKILDFGIARAANLERSDDFDAGALGALTPAYATAEMVRREDPSFSDDVYALACVLYYMLAGKHPYQNRSAVEAEKQGLKPARPDNLSNREWQALSAALSTSKAKRPQTVEAFHSAFMPPKRALNLKTIAAVLLLGPAGWATSNTSWAASGRRLWPSNCRPPGTASSAANTSAPWTTHASCSAWRQTRRRQIPCCRLRRSHCNSRPGNRAWPRCCRSQKPAWTAATWPAHGCGPRRRCSWIPTTCARNSLYRQWKRHATTWWWVTSSAKPATAWNVMTPHAPVSPWTALLQPGHSPRSCMNYASAPMNWPGACKPSVRHLPHAANNFSHRASPA